MQIEIIPNQMETALGVRDTVLFNVGTSRDLCAPAKERNDTSVMVSPSNLVYCPGASADGAIGADIN